MEIDTVRAALSGKYLVQRELGRGVTGTVYLAQDEAQGRAVAIKVLRSASRETAELERRFHREARVARRLQHRHIVDVFDIDSDGGLAYYVMELVEGESLQQILDKQRTLSVADALAVAVALASALEYAHRAGVVHRDIKPSNVLIPGRSYPDAKLTDFGLYGGLHPETNQTRSGEVFGTVLYMAPEQLRGEPQDARTDVFGLGMLIYSMVYGGTPYRTGDTLSVVNAILFEDISLPELPDISPSLRDFIHRCLAKAPAQRPSSALRELREIQRKSLGEATPVVACLSPEPNIRAWRKQPRAKTSTKRTALVVGGLALCVGPLVVNAWWPLGPSLVGTCLVIGGVLLGIGARQLLHRRSSALGEDADRLLANTGTHEALTQSLAIQLDEILKRCTDPEDRFLGTSIAIMIDEFRQTQNFNDRHQALVASVSFLEKLMPRLSPWYVRYEKLIAAAVALIGIVPGVFKIVDALR